MLGGSEHMAHYVIIYRKHGFPAGLTPGSGELETVKQTARNGLIRRGADEFEIRADNSEGATIWKERRNT